MFIEGAPRQTESGTGPSAEAVPKTKVAEAVSKVLSHEMPEVVTDTTATIDIRGTVDALYFEADKGAHAIMHRICDEV